MEQNNRKKRGKKKTFHIILRDKYTLKKLSGRGPGKIYKWSKLKINVKKVE